MKKADLAALLLCLSALGFAVAYPIAVTVAQAVAGWDWEILRSPAGWQALFNTIWMSLASVALSGLMGTGLAWLLTQYRFPGRGLLAVAAYLPFALPPLVGVLSFYYLIGRDGFFPRLLDQAFGWEDAAPSGAAAILTIHVYSFYVYFYATVSAALLRLDASLAEAARTLGAGPWGTFLKVTLPQLRPALAGGALLTFMSSTASFSAPYFFGGDFPMLSVLIYDLRSQFQNEAALTLTIVLACAALLGVLLFRGRAGETRVAGKGTPRTVKGGGTRLALGVAAWVFALLLVLPHVAILWFAFADHRAWHTELLPTHFTLENFRAIFSTPAALAPIRNSIWASLLATGAVLIVGLPAAWITGRRRIGARAVHLLVVAPWAIPATVIGMGLIAAFNYDWLPLYNTIWLLPLAYFVRGVPMFTRIAASAVEPFDASLVEAARTLGATPAYTAWRVVLPLISPAVAAGAGLVFASSLGEFVASILVFVPGNTPIAVHINQVWRSGTGPAFAYAVLLMLLTAGAFGVARRFSGRTV